MSYRHKERPCPGCGKMEKMPEQTLCGKCAGFMAKARDIVASYESAVSRGVYFLNEGSMHLEIARTGVDGSAISIPYINGGSVRTVVEALVKTAKDPTYKGHSYGEVGKDLYGVMTERNHSQNWSIKLPVDFANSINLLVKEIGAYGQACYDCGHRDGDNLLRRLARGEVTPNQFEVYHNMVASEGERRDCDKRGYHGRCMILFNSCIRPDLCRIGSGNEPKGCPYKTGGV